jgi:glutathione S-transferase
MRLYHMPPSRSTAVLWLLEEIGAPYDVTLITRAEKEGEAHRTRHPLGRVPVIEENGRHLFETGAICLHLADLHPEAALIAAPGSPERALTYQWLFFAKTEIEPYILRTPDDGSEHAATMNERLRAAALVVEEALAGTEYLVGDRFGVTDVPVGSILLLADRFQLLEGMPNIEAYCTRLAARPAFERSHAIGPA